MANKIVKGIIEAKWWAKILLVIVTGVLFLVAVNVLLKFITNHGQSQPVPKIKGLVYDEAIEVLKAKGLRYVVFDSVYVPKAKPNQIIEQNPVQGSKVKKDRIVYLTINALPVPIVKVPSVTEISLKEAVSKLQAAGLEVGEITTRPDITLNWVLEQKYQGKFIKEGTEIPKGSKIDLIVSRGENEGDNNLKMPDLIGLTVDEATIEMKLIGLNIGAVSYDPTVNDRTKAIIYKQTPAAGTQVYIGKEIDVYLKEVQ